MRRRRTFRLAPAALAILAIGVLAVTDRGPIRAQIPPIVSGVDSDDPAPTAIPNTIVALPAPSDGPIAPGASIVPGTVTPLVLAAGFGQTKPGAPITVAAIVRNQGAATDLNVATISVYDAGGTVIAAGDATLHYMAAGETTGFAHRLSPRNMGAAAKAEIQIGGGKQASDPLPGALTFSQTAWQQNRGGPQASAVLTSSYASDLTEVRVDAIAFDSNGSIVGGGETLKRLVPAGAQVGVIVPLDVTGTPSRVDLYAHLP